MNRNSQSPREGDVDQIPRHPVPDESVSRAGIYARTSKQKPEFHYSIAEQVERCWGRCQQYDWEVVVICTDEAETGRNTDRPEFQKLLQYAEHGLIDVVVFWRLDRFCRSLVDLVNIERELRECDVALQSVTEHIDTTSSVGRFNFRNLASAAELESDLTSERVQIGLHGMAKENRWPNDNPPIGYDLSDDQTLVINEEAALVERIFQSYLEHRSMPAVARELNDEGETTNDGQQWDRWSVRTVLTNEIYRGQYELGDYREQVEEYRIVSDDLFSRVTETRFRFKGSRTETSSERKVETGERILSKFTEAKEG